MEDSKSKKKETWGEKLRRKYRIVIFNSDTYEERSHVILSRMNVIVIVVTLAVILVVLTIYLIAFTPLREYIPGYTDVNLSRRVYEIERRADSIEKALIQKDLYIQNLNHIISDDGFFDDSISAINASKPISSAELDKITFVKSAQDSMLRSAFEAETQYNLYGNIDLHRTGGSITNFFVPLDGVVTYRFNRNEGHFGIDIAANSNEIIKSISDGTVIYADWTIDRGYVIGIQHAGNYFSVYKHNSSLLKKEGDFVKAGEAIAYLGESGELSTGPHLHFELWHNGLSVNPEEYIMFENNN